MDYNLHNITLNLFDLSYEIFNKTGNEPLYLYSQSNHPPVIIDIKISVEKKGLQLKVMQIFLLNFWHSDVKTQVHHYTSGNNDIKTLKIANV